MIRPGSCRSALPSSIRAAEPAGRNKSGALRRPFFLSRPRRFSLGFLGVTADDVPRFRDCFVDERGRIAVHTRTGGGNRAFYDCEARCRDEYPEYFTGEKRPSGPWNADLRTLPGFLYDEDDDFDSTYATFYFAPSEEVAKLVSQLTAIGGAGDPAERWRALFADMEAGAENKQVARALEIGKPIIEAITASLSSDCDFARMAKPE